MDTVPISILVEIVSYLHFKDIKSLTDANTYVRNKLDTPIFWKIYYSRNLGKKLCIDGVWKDLMTIDDMIENETKSYPSMEQFIYVNPQLIEIYLKLIGIDILDQETTSLDYLQSYIRLRFYEHFLGNARTCYRNYYIQNTVNFMLKTPSPVFLHRILGILDKVHTLSDSVYNYDFLDIDLKGHSEQYDRRESKHKFNPDSQIPYVKQFMISLTRKITEKSKESTGTVCEFLDKWKVWIKKTGLDDFLAHYFSVDIIRYYMPSFDLPPPREKLMEEFFMEFLA